MEGDMAVIDQDECVDCGVCRNSGVCSVDCIIFEETPESLSQDFVVLIVPAMAGK
jgi:NAD-dependent dihydropyrimidine dehydrogenase PreA subunit